VSPRTGDSELPLARWIIACTLGELIGFGVGGGLAALAFVSIPDPTSGPLATALLLACVGAGLVEGAILGAFQWLALRSALPSLTIAAWSSVTALAGATGWALGSLPSIVMSLTSGADAPPATDPGLLVTLLAASALGLALGALFGAFQWIALRRHVRRGGSWIAANAIAWALALPWSFVAGGSIAAASSPVLAVSGAALAGAAMGLTVALVTGLFLRRMTRATPERRAYSAPSMSPARRG
jgi:hypothetical protein